MTIVVLGQPCEAESGSAFHYGPGFLSQETCIACKKIVIEQVVAEPRSGHVPIVPMLTSVALISHGPGLSPDIRIVVRAPAGHSIINSCRPPSVDGQIFDQL